VESEPLKSSVVKEVQPGSNVTSTEDLTEYFKKSLWTVFHPTGTCAMLPRKDGGVVDEKLRVYGTSNLRVVDASIIPLITSTHIQATVYAIAEKAAQIIQDKH